MLAIAFLALHIVTAVLDSFAPISLVDAVVPFVGTYRPLWLGLGATAFDLLLAVAVTSARAASGSGHRGVARRALARLCGVADRRRARAGHRQRPPPGMDGGGLRRLRGGRDDGRHDPDRARLGRPMCTGGWPAWAPWPPLGLGVAVWLPRGPLRAPLGPTGRHAGEAPGTPARGGHGALPRLLTGVTPVADAMGPSPPRVHGDPADATGDPRSCSPHIERSGLRGRGGGAFPMATKMEAVKRSRGTPILLVNGVRGRTDERQGPDAPGVASRIS